MKLYILKSLLLLFFLSTDAYAYLDPGSGSIILQAILGFIAASIATVSFYWGKVKIFLRNLFKKKKDSERN